MALSDQHEIVASEDIVDDSGHKLWAQGQKVSRSLQEKLQRHKLARPLESALTVEGGIVSDEVVTACLELVESNSMLQRISGSVAARSLLTGFRNTPLPGPFKLLLTSAREGKLASYRHGLHCVAITAGIAARLNVGDDAVQQLLLSSLIHDIGELYIDPGYLHSNTRLTPAEWKQVAVHPRIGQALVRELTSLPAKIGDAVAEHHERLDGSGYPAQKANGEIGKFGRIIGVADTCAAIVMHGADESTYRLRVATRIVPEEFERTVVDAVIKPLLSSPLTPPSMRCEDCLDRIRLIVERLDQSMVAAASLAAHKESRIAADIGGYVVAALKVLSKALTATGAIEALSVEEVKADEELLAEIALVAREVDWRLRNLARNIHLRFHLNHDGKDLALALPLVDTLDSSAR
ncbi:MAG: HD domain-containing protein [Gammaproteobacteria bacterium]|nr:HD domain-containing protein [Gammaproteobacteria bacterium]MBU1414913.1 HD domain-containing protein [Gammaproteobacteria bacterium]